MSESKAIEEIEKNGQIMLELLNNKLMKRLTESLTYQCSYVPSVMGWQFSVHFLNRCLYIIRLEGHNFEFMTMGQIIEAAAEHLGDSLLSVLLRHANQYNCSRIVKLPKEEEEEDNG